MSPWIFFFFFFFPILAGRKWEIITAKEKFLIYTGVRMIPFPLPEKCKFSQGNHSSTSALNHNSLLIYGWVQLKTQSLFSSLGTKGNLIPETLPKRSSERWKRPWIYGAGEQEGGIEKSLGIVFVKCSGAGGICSSLQVARIFYFKKRQDQNHFINSSSFC